MKRLFIFVISNWCTHETVTVYGDDDVHTFRLRFVARPEVTGDFEDAMCVYRVCVCVYVCISVCACMYPAPVCVCVCALYNVPQCSAT